MSISQERCLFLLGLSFTRDGKLVALAERRDVKDFIGIYSTDDWRLLSVEMLLL